VTNRVVANGQIWRHKKTGTEYEIVDIEAMVQVSSFPELIREPYSLEDEPWVAYRPVNGYRLFVRLREEFLDGRFDFIRHTDE